MAFRQGRGVPSDVFFKMEAPVSVSVSARIEMPFVDHAVLVQLPVEIERISEERVILPDVQVDAGQFRKGNWWQPIFEGIDIFIEERRAVRADDAKQLPVGETKLDSPITAPRDAADGAALPLYTGRIAALDAGQKNLGEGLAEFGPIRAQAVSFSRGMRMIKGCASPPAMRSSTNPAVPRSGHCESV